MEKKAGEERETGKHRSYLVMKILLLVLCVVVLVLLAVVAKGFTSLKDLNDRLNTLEEEKCLKGEKHDQGTRRKKRSIDEIEFNKALTKLEKLEERFNESRPEFVLRGPPGKNGAPGKNGTKGPPGKSGGPGYQGKDGGNGAQGARGHEMRQEKRGGVQGERGLPGPRGPKGSSANVGVTYIRWGRKTCPYNGASLVYEGYVGGSDFNVRGGGSNYVCLTRHPIYAKYQSGLQSPRARIYGAEYQTATSIKHLNDLVDHDVPCAVCHVTKRASQIMIPGRNVCPAGWIREYKGYLMAERRNHYRTMYTCVDEYPDYTHGSYANRNGVLFYFVDGVCGSLPCKPYIKGRELTCAVCTR